MSTKVDRQRASCQFKLSFENVYLGIVGDVSRLYHIPIDYKHTAAEGISQKIYVYIVEYLFLTLLITYIIWKL